MDDDKDLDTTLWQRVRRRPPRYTGVDRRERPLISNNLKWLIGLAIPLAVAGIKMYSNQQVIMSTLGSIKAAQAQHLEREH